MKRKKLNTLIGTADPFCLNLSKENRIEVFKFYHNLDKMNEVN